MKLLLALLALAGSAAETLAPVPPAVMVIVGATLVDGGGRAALADSVVVVRGDVIAAVGDRVHTSIPKGAALIDGRRAFIAPAPATPTSAAALPAAVAEMVRGSVALVQAGRPAHLALLDADPRPDGASPRVRRLWIAGRSRPIPPEPDR